MDERQKLAAVGLAEGRTVEEVANVIGRNPRTIFKWLVEPEFQAHVLHGLRALALLSLAQYLKHGEDPKAGQAALATLRWLGAGGKTTRTLKDARAVKLGEDGGIIGDDETDLGEFSEESLRRLKGEDK